MLEVLFVLGMILGCGNCQYIIQDVWGQPPAMFTGEWITNSCLGSTYTSVCNGQTIIGGNPVMSTGNYAMKTYTGLPGHNTLTIQFEAYYLDTWDGGPAINPGGAFAAPFYDSYLLYADDNLIYWNIYKMGTAPDGTANICGLSYPDWITTLTIPISHNSSSLTLNFTTGLNEGCEQEEFGFKNVQITVDVICTSACATCYGNANTQCYSCNSGWYLYENTCGTTCPQGYYPSGTYCYSCYSNCYNCNGPYSSECTQCSGLYLNMPPHGSCSSSCPGGYYGNGGDWECLQCYQGSGSPYYTCPTCSGGNYNQCTACNSGSFLYPNTGGECINPCPNGYWGQTGSQTCQPCYNSGSGPYYTCQTCSGGNNNQCTSCNSGTFLYPNTGGKCINPCPNGYWGQTGSQTCQPCYSSGSGPYYTCPTCSGGNNNQCTACNSGSFLYPSTGGECINPCPNGYWGQTGSQTCQPCYNSGSGPYYTCQTCSGGNNNQCTSCNSGTFLYPNTGGKCINPCPNGYWGQTGSQTCQPCYSSGSGPYYTCPTCSGGNNNQCTACNSGTFLYPNTEGECINPCPNGFWGDSSTNTCQTCYSSGLGPYYTCATCSRAGSSSCLSCNSGYFLYPSNGGTCFNPCPNGFWGNISTNTCQTCYSSSIGPYYSCSTCSRGGANNNCDSCNSGSFLYSSQCLSACPDGYWPDNTTNTCQLCSSYTVNTSSCPTKVQSNIVSALQISAKSSSTVLVATSAALQNSNSASSTLNINLFLYLAAIEAIANMQYLNLNHSQIALDAYSGLSASLIPNWISNYNTINSSLLVFNYGIFEKNQISPLYLDNNGDSLIETLIYAGVYLILVPITFIKTSERLLSSRLGKAYAIALGLFLSNVFGQIQSQILFSVLQILKTDLLVDVYSRLSYSIAWLTMYVVMWLQLFCFCRLKAIFSLKQRCKNMVDIIAENTHNQNQLPTNTNFRWTEKKYEMMFSSYKDDNKLRFFFTYWVILFDTIYISLIICLQYVPGLQCLSIVLLTIYFIIFSVLLGPMKEKSEAFLFFFNYASVLLVAILNLALAVREVSKSQPTNNDDIGWAIFIIIAVNSCVNILFALCGILSRIYSLFRKWKDRRQKANEETKKDQTNGKSRSSQRASQFIDASNSASNFIEEEEKEETPEPQSKLRMEGLKIIKKKHEHSLRRKEKKINIPELEETREPQIKLQKRVNRNK